MVPMVEGDKKNGTETGKGKKQHLGLEGDNYCVNVYSYEIFTLCEYMV